MNLTNGLLFMIVGNTMADGFISTLFTLVGSLIALRCIGRDTMNYVSDRVNGDYIPRDRY